jgi:hypothetical protein
MKIRIEVYDDWEKLFIDGECVAADNLLHRETIFKVLREKYGIEVEDEWLMGEPISKHGNKYQRMKNRGREGDTADYERLSGEVAVD